MNGKTKVLHVLTILNIVPAGSKGFRLLPDSRINAGARNNYYLIKEKEKENKKFIKLIACSAGLLFGRVTVKNLVIVYLTGNV